MNALACPDMLPVAPVFRGLPPLRTVTMPVEFDSIELVRAIAARADRAAFARLFEHWAPRIKAYVLRLGAAADLAEEIAQETMLTIWRKAGQYDPARATIGAWIFTIARNLRIDALRRQRFLAPEADESETASLEPGADTMIAAGQAARRVGSALASLPPEQAEVLRLSFFEDRPHAEIERRLGVPLGTVKSRLRLAMAKLRVLLDDLK
jgi:RNA polymerase sigma-70 factor (ECF subfamily)